MTIQINKELKSYCESHDYMRFVDAAKMTYDGTNFEKSLFISDGIHLNRDGQLKWCKEYIKPEIEALIKEYNLNELRK